MSNGDRDIARLYHDATKLAYLDFQRKPPAYKRYMALPSVALPTDFAPLVMPALEAVAATVPPASAARPLDLTALAGLLFFAFGRMRTRAFAGAGEVTFRAAASAGGLYPIEAYVVCGDLPGLAAGVYHFAPADFRLTCLRQGDYRSALAAAAGPDSTVARAAATLVCSAVFWRSAWKYRVRSYRYCFWDNGTIMANLLAAASAMGQPVHVLLGFVDTRVNHLLGLDGHREASTCLVSLGPPADPAPPAEAASVAPLDVATAPSAHEEIDYPEITRLHTAAALPTPEAVAAWRGALTPPAARPGGPQYRLPEIPALPGMPRSLGDTIRQRGSTRRFAPEPVSFSQLSSLLLHATRGIPADFLGPGTSSLLDVYLIVHAVTDLPAGSYVFTPAAPALELLRPGDFREEAGHLCFEQALGADASAVVFFMADLEGVLQRFGNRGYRAVQFEAGTVGGKLYLCAGALGLGASGLTFYDDEVTAFFAPHATGKSAIFVVALGHTAETNRVRPFRSRLGMRLDARSRLDA